jgi:hypothetical protein
MSRFRIYPAVLLCLLLAACASPGTRGTSSALQSATAAERAKARWTAIVEGRLDAAYEFLTPGARSTQSREEYVEQQAVKPVHYKSVTATAESCEADSCIVTADLEYEVRIPLAGVGAQTIAASVDERWIRLDGTWYFLPDDLR